MVKEIQSVSNPLVKLITSLSQKKNVLKHKLTFVEGEKIIHDLLEQKYPVKTVLLTNEHLELLPFLHQFNKVEIFIISKPVASKISNMVTTAGVFALVELTEQNAFLKNEKYLVLDTVQDPSNLGAIVRSALAYNYKQIILVNSVYPFLPKVIRSSMGYVFNVSFYSFTTNEFLNFAKNENLKLLGAKMDGKNIRNFSSNNQNFGFVVGNEGNGVGNEIQSICYEFVAIPMQNEVESLNVAVSASIIMHELSK